MTQTPISVTSDGDVVRVEPTAQVIADRTTVAKNILHMRPLTPARREQLDALAWRSDHQVMLPTHVIERNAAVVGYVGINSMPIYRIWMRSDDVPARETFELCRCIENHYRMTGVELVGTFIDVDCNCYPYAARNGYSEVPDERLHLKLL